MKLAPMRYKDYIWPHNPKVYSINFQRRMGTGKVPFGRFYLQDLGLEHRVMRGEGEFVGAGAYSEFKKLASVFYSEGPGLLVHPVWQSVSAYFVALSLAQEPRADYVKYRFEFWEVYNGERTGLSETGEKKKPASGGKPEGGGQWHTVVRGESLWSIAAKYGRTLTDVIALNPQLKNPNLIFAGERIRVK